MGILDSSNCKSVLRTKHKNYRKLMNREEKANKDFQIFQKLNIATFIIVTSYMES